MLSRRYGVRAVDLRRLKFEIKHKSHCLQKNKLVNWGGWPPLAPVLLSRIYSVDKFAVKRTVIIFLLLFFIVGTKNQR